MKSGGKIEGSQLSLVDVGVRMCSRIGSLDLQCPITISIRRRQNCVMSLVIGHTDVTLAPLVAS